VLFVCVKNGGKSQMAAGLMRSIAGDTVDVHSAGTQPAGQINGLSAQSLLEIGVDITDQQPQPVTEQLIRDADLVITLGREVTVDQIESTRSCRKAQVSDRRVMSLMAVIRTIRTSKTRLRVGPETNLLVRPAPRKDPAVPPTTRIAARRRSTSAVEMCGINAVNDAG
jgi:protein-tyrosine-phosphatase